MDHAATMRHMYDLLNAGDVDGFGDALADDFIDHEELPGFPSTKEGTKEFFHMYLAAFPTCGWSRRMCCRVATRSSLERGRPERIRVS